MISFVTLSGCENAEQRKLYDQAVGMEQNSMGDRSNFTVEAYRNAVRLDPSSRLGRDAQERIDRIQNNINQNRMIQEQRRTTREMEFNNLMNQ